MTFAPLFCAILLGAPLDGEVNFDTHIIPILTKAGCNAGACHGAAAGRGGFNLSLLGSDPAADYDSIVHQYEGRRINLAAPSKSLLLAKPTGFIDHGGEMIFDAESPEAKRIRAWIESGASRGLSRTLTRFDVTPQRTMVELGSAPTSLRATASFDGGPPEDVTTDVLFTATDASAIAFDHNGPSAKLLRSGQHIVIARYLDRVVPIEFLVPFQTQAKQLKYPEPANFIDEEIFAALKALRIPLSSPADDSAFLRRVSLDLTGRLLSVELAERYPNDRSPDKREKLVDELLSSEAFNDYWTYRFARALDMHSLPNDKIGVATYAAWIKEQIRGGTPLNDVAAALLTATGDSHEYGPPNFARMVSDARAQAELVGKVFMGVRLGCANCHNHPLDRWTQDDFHGFAAVFAKLDRGQVVKLTQRGAVTNLRTGEPAVPRIPGLRYLEGDGDGLQETAKALTATNDRQFARAIVNRLWQAMMGRGLVEPIDDMRQTNPPSHPELLRKLTDDFAEHGYNLRRALRQIVLSETYARSAQTTPENAADDRFYSRAYAKPMLPEVLADAVDDVLQSQNDDKDRHIKIIDPLEPAPTLDILGRCNRAGGCADGESRARGLAAQLHILNGEFINAKFARPEHRLTKMLSGATSTAEIIREFYLAGLTREPTNEELQNWSKKLDVGGETKRRERLEDFVWSMLSSKVFTENR